MRNTLTTILIFTLFISTWAEVKYNAGVKIPAQKNTIYVKDFEKDIDMLENSLQMMI